MFQSKVKLFGKMIQFTSNDDVSDASVSPKSLENKKQSNAAMDSTEEEETKPCPRCESNDTKHNPEPNFNCFPATPWYPAPVRSPQLGKHSREGEVSMKSKTLRIDDPDEVAKSSIWATLGIKNEKVNSIGSVGVFGGFQSKAREANSVADGSLALYANPAAFSRSLRFHESAE